MSARLLLVLLCGAVAACGSFEAKWRAAKTAGASRWDGRWTSEKHRAINGAAEGGRLRCVLTEVAADCFPAPHPARPRRALNAAFHAHWLLFASDFTLALTPVAGSRTDFRGTQELPAIFGGTYRYEARLTGGHFTARYDSRYDRGTFALTRVRP